MTQAVSALDPPDSHPFLFDTHFHLSEAVYAGHERELLDALPAASVRGVLVPSYSLESCRIVAELKTKFPSIAVAFGLHPQFLSGDLQAIHRLIGAGKPAAIGEIGLDYSRKPFDRLHQSEVLREQLGWAHGSGIPVILHCVRAHGDLVRILTGYSGVAGVLHRASCAWGMARKYLDRGFFFGVGPDILDPRHRTARGLAVRLPADRIVLETDAPFIRRPDGRLYGPADLGEVLGGLAGLRGASPGPLAETILRNTRALFPETLNFEP